MSSPAAHLGEVATFLNGGTPARSNPAFFEGSIPWITGADITGPIVIAARSKITEQAIRSSATNLVPAGTILLVTRTSVGKVAISGVPLCFSQDITAVLHDSTKVDSGYLVHFLKTQQQRFERIARGATIKGITRENIESTLIPLPSLPEQRRIVTILDKAEELRAKRRAALALLDQLPQAIFLKMFGEPETDWPRTDISGVLAHQDGAIRTGPFGTQLLHSEFVDDGIAVLGIDNAVHNEFRWGQRRFITTKKYERLKRYTVRPGDVLITIMGTCGRCAVVPQGIPAAINTKHLCCMTLDQRLCLPQFLHSYFLFHPAARKYLQQTTKGAIMGGLNMAIIRRLPLTLPPIGLQHEYAALSSEIEKAEVAQYAAAEKADELADSLVSRLLGVAA